MKKELSNNKLPMRRSWWRKFVDFILFPLRALVLIEKDKWGLSSLASERFFYVSEQVQGFCLDVGCGKNNRFVTEFLGGNGKGIDVYKYEGLTNEHIVEDMSHLSFDDASFDSITFIANINHIPEPNRDTELAEAHRALKSGWSQSTYATTLILCGQIGGIVTPRAMKPTVSVRLD